MESLWAQDRSGRFIDWSSGDEKVVYDALTGDTHFLEIVAVAVLKQLASAPRSKQDLAKDLSDAFDLRSDEDAGILTALTLVKLQGIGLVVSFP